MILSDTGHHAGQQTSELSQLPALPGAKDSRRGAAVLTCQPPQGRKQDAAPTQTTAMSWGPALRPPSACTHSVSLHPSPPSPSTEENAAGERWHLVSPTAAPNRSSCASVHARALRELPQPCPPSLTDPWAPELTGSPPPHSQRRRAPPTKPPPTAPAASSVCGRVTAAETERGLNELAARAGAPMRTARMSRGHTALRRPQERKKDAGTVFGVGKDGTFGPGGQVHSPQGVTCVTSCTVVCGSL